MHPKAVLVVFLLLSMPSFGMKKYTIPREDFLKQLSRGSIRPDRVYCYREDGTKVWLLYNKSSILTIKLTNKGEKEVLLHSVRLKNGMIEATVYNVWWSGKKVYSISINDIHSFYIERKTQESVMNYVDIDSSRQLARLKNDSLKNSYAQRNEWMISWEGHKDTFYIRENACYHMDFKDNNQTAYGIVQKITKDSIYISNVYNPDWASVHKTSYRMLVYAIPDITQLRLLKPGGYGYKAVQSKDYQVVITHAERKNLPVWYAANPGSGEPELYHAWLTLNGFRGIREEKGKIYWFEGM